MKSEKLEIYYILYEIFDYRLAKTWRKAKRFMKYGRKKGKDARGSAPSTCHRAEANGDGQTVSPESEAVIPGEETKHSDHRASSGRNRSAEEPSDEEATANVSGVRSVEAFSASDWWELDYTIRYHAVPDGAGILLINDPLTIAAAVNKAGYIISRISGDAASELRPDDRQISEPDKV